MQFLRLLKEIGWLRVCVLIIIICIAIIQILPLVQLQSEWFGLMVLPFILPLSLFSIEASFLKNLDYNPFKVRLCRNLFFSIPVILLLLITGNLIGMMVALTSIVLMSLQPFRLIKFDNRLYPSFFKDAELLPWRVGIRNSIWMLAGIVIITIGGAVHITFTFLAIFLFHFVVLSFFNVNESQFILESYGKNPKELLKFYVTKHLKYYGIFQLAILVMAFFFYPDFYYVFPLIGLLLILHQGLVVLLKFSFYTPGESNEAMQSIQTLMLVFLFIPFTFPIPFWYVWKYRKRALNNLSIYL